ncbi:MAG TPA: hypothetical protein EYG89_01680 [Bacteroidia bacterium]|nr:hypothetical protein [Bacteroidia bacterium]
MPFKFIKMSTYFAVVLLAITGLLLLKYFILFLITKKFPLSKRKIIITLIEIIVASVFFTIIFVFSKKYNDISYIVAPIFLALIPTYHFTIKPLQYLLYNKSNKSSIAIEKLLVNKGFTYKVRVINSKNANAFATGIIPFYKLILIDEKILNELTEEQALSIIYHEVGHHELNHLKKLLVINIFITFFLYHIIRQNPKNLIFILFVVSIYVLVYSYSTSKIQYRYEFQADTFSANMNTKKNLIEALKKFDEISNNRIAKGGISHPPLIKRIENINNER